MKLTEREKSQASRVSSRLSMAERARRAGLPVKTVEARISRGMTAEEALSTPVMTKAQAGALAHRNRRGEA